jgi:diguanylate cyclase (GGDEF)-like protein
MNAAPMRGRDDGDERPARFESSVVSDAVALAARVCEMRIAAVGLLNGEHLDLVARVGPLPAGLSLRNPLVARILYEGGGRRLVIHDASRDPSMASSPLVVGKAAIRSIAAVPLTDHTGAALGCVIVMDRRPGALRPDQIEALDAIGRLLAAHLELQSAVGRLERAAVERQRYEQHLEEYQIRLERHLVEISERSNTDPLTGLQNRGSFRDRLSAEIRHTLDTGRPLTLVLLDVDAFKPFNDTFGHLAGDEVLRSIAFVFGERVRATDVVARLGGDEFAIILPNTEAEGGHVLAERLRRAVEGTEWPERPMTVSAGVAAAAGPGADADALLAAADRALYAAKRAGRNQVVLTA